MTLVSSAVGCKTYSSAPLSRINCTVKAPCSHDPFGPRDPHVRDLANPDRLLSVLLRHLISLHPRDWQPCPTFVPVAKVFKLAARSLCFRAGSVACLGEVFVVEAYRVPDGVFGLLWVGEVAHVHLLAFQHLVVLDAISRSRRRCYPARCNFSSHAARPVGSGPAPVGRPTLRV